MKIAIADIGSNTVKMTVFSEEGKILFKKSTPVGLMGYIRDGVLSKEGIDRLSKTLALYGKLALHEGAGTLYPFATASLRAASNAHAVIAQIEDETGFPIDLVSGEEEAALSFRGVALLTGTPLKEGTLLDMGGGSCEVISEGGSALSLPVGSLALFLKHIRNILPTEEELKAVYAYTDTLAEKAGVSKKSGEVLAVGGTLRAFCQLHAAIYGKSFSEALPYRITREEVVHILSLVTDMSNETKMTVLRLIPERAHTFAPGITAVLALTDRLGSHAFTVVAGGAREGYFLKLKDKLYRQKEEAL